MNDTAVAQDFNLEASDPAGLPPDAVIEELRGCRRTAKEAVKAYADALGAQAAKYKVKRPALKRYIAALEEDAIEEAEAEMNDLERLLEK